MRISAAQIKPVKGNISVNITNHIKMIDRASAHQVDLILFPELSLTGYEPGLADKLAIENGDIIFQEIQEKSDKNNMTICAGLPTRSNFRVYISMVIFQPRQSPKIYSKQFIHTDELPYFSKGGMQIYCDLKNMKIAPAICYESLLPEHAENVFQNKANIYAASVAKPKRGLEKGMKHYPAIAKKYGMTVLMANCVGYCDNFMSMGSSAVWNKKGEMVGQLGEEEEGLLIYDLNNGECKMNNAK